MASETRLFASSVLTTIPELDESNWINWYRRIDNTLINKNYFYRKLLDRTLFRPVRFIEFPAEIQEAYQARFDK
jgi:hypothetical protein